MLPFLMRFCGCLLIFFPPLFLSAFGSHQSLWPAVNCKLTKIGNDYLGNVDKTLSGKICENWSRAFSENELKDFQFPEGSAKAAKNFCRNPDGDERGPWCFVLAGQREYCNVPFCNTEENCRLTGVGQEYQGSVSTSVSGNKCQHWKFEDLSDTNSCANPTGSSLGPWCFVQNLDTNLVEMEPCDVPICDFPMCSFVISASEFSHFVELGGRKRLQFRFKAWDASLQNMQSAVRILLSSTPHLQGNKGFQLEIKPAHLGGGLTLQRWTPTSDGKSKNGLFAHWGGHHLKMGVSGSWWSEIWIEWDEAEIRAGLNADFVSLDIGEEKLRFYSLAGLPSMWQSTPESCCETHATSPLGFSPIWFISSGTEGFELDMRIRAFSSPVLQLHSSPQADDSLGHLEIFLEDLLEDKVFWVKNSVRRLIADKKREFPLFTEFSNWQHFKLRSLGSELELLSSDETIFKFRDSRVSGLRWFSIGSNGTFALWKIGACKVSNAAEEQHREWCKQDSVGFGYEGTQSASARGFPCLPWTHPRVDGALQDAALFPDASLEDASNFCRNPDRRSSGPWCYTTEKYFPPKSCGIRDCQLDNCRKAGTGNDFMGTLNVTFGQKSCQKWSTMYPHVINFELLRPENFPEGSVEGASNFCRNPSKAIIGSYCFTTDPTVRVDACKVPSCHKDIIDSQTLIVKGRGERGQNSVFMTPEWRENKLHFHVKQWDPHVPDGLVIFLRPFKGETLLKLVIGADKNSAVKLFHSSPKSGEVLVYQKRVSHVVSVSNWASFKLHVNPEKLQFGFQSHPFPFMEWNGDEANHPLFSPVYLNFATEFGGPVGLNLPSKECLTFHEEGEEGSIFPYMVGQRAHLFLPTNLWRDDLTRPKKLDIFIKGLPKSKFSVAFSTLGDFQNGYDLIHFTTNTISFSYITNEEFFFRHITIRYTGAELLIETDDPLLSVKWTHNQAIMWYIFSTAATGNVVWSANCSPQDVDRVRDGDWSQWGEWRCSAACGGGHGLRERTCSAPRPSVLGKFCKGHSMQSGACNEQPCGEVSISTKRRMRAFYNSAAHSFKRRPGQALNFSCNPPFLGSVFNEMALGKEAAAMAWSNSEGILTNNKETNISRFYMENLSAKDTGLYSLVVLRPSDPNAISTACFFTLAVWREAKVHANERLALEDNVGDLPLLYRALTVKWVKGDEVVKNFALNPDVQAHSLVIETVRPEHSGEWSCFVTQHDLGLVWITAWYNIHVLPPKTLGLFSAQHSLLSMVFEPITFLFGDMLALPVFVLLCVTTPFLLLLTLVRFCLRETHSYLPASGSSAKFLMTSDLVSFNPRD
ncbi:uncharacterized protein LOC132201555 [Neocloeon triangulifer]|uniref:uncharacterized protein LOC132201555 n=1 Tax=Neocloeon triangulifer TaxID=2078957 RepID=UPI00286F3109|nr:uncharacterized protein LOC132201555 [Neocloeon triangulifer]